MHEIFRLCSRSKTRPKSLLHKNCRYQLLATVLVNIVTFSHGVGVGWLSPTLIKIQTPDSPLSFTLSIDEVSWLGGMLGLGSLCGNIVIGLLLDRAGRKWCLYLVAFPYACLWILVYFAWSVEFLYAARFLCGFTGGASYLVVPIFVSEIADTEVRGSLSSIVMLSVNSGVLVGFVLASHLSYHLIPFIAILLPIAYFVACLCLPETATHLLRKGKTFEAEKAFMYYRNLKLAESRPEFEDLKEIITKNQTSMTRQLSYRDFITKQALKAFASALVLSFGYQFSGIFSFINYMSEIFALSGSVLDPNTCTIIIGVVQIVGVYTSTMYVDIYGRRILMLISTGGIGLGCIAFGCFTYFAQHHDFSAFNWLPLVLMILVVYLANIGLIGLFFVVLVEVLPAKIRSVATMILVAILSALVFVTLKLFPLLLHHFGISITMWFSATASLLTFFYFLLFLQETKDKSMLEN